MNDKEKEISTYLDAIDFAIEEIQGAVATIKENRRWIYDLINAEEVIEEL